jgi:hypothetical protein
MRQNVANVNLAPIKMDGGDQPILVAAYIEYNPIANLISRWKGFPQLCKIAIPSLADDLKPTQKGRTAIGMLLPKESQGLARDNVHSGSISQYEINSHSNSLPAGSHPEKRPPGQQGQLRLGPQALLPNGHSLIPRRYFIW